MLDRTIIIVLSVCAFCLMACGATPAQVNNVGHEAYLEGDYATALQSYLDAQELASVSGEPYYNVANVLYRMGRYEDSLESYDESIRHANGELRARGFFNRGNASFQQQRYGQAVEAYEEVLRIDPDDGDAKHNLELALRQQAGAQDETEQQAEEQEDETEQQAEEQQDEAEQQAEEQEDEAEQQAEEQEQNQDAAEAQARQLLESVGESAQTLQERRGQVLVSPKPPSEFDW